MVAQDELALGLVAEMVVLVTVRLVPLSWVSVTPGVVSVRTELICDIWLMAFGGVGVLYPKTLPPMPAKLMMGLVTGWLNVIVKVPMPVQTPVGAQFFVPSVMMLATGWVLLKPWT